MSAITNYEFMSLYCPNVMGLSEQDIMHIFHTKSIGCVHRVDFFETETYRGVVMNAMIHLSYWYPTQQSLFVYETIRASIYEGSHRSYNLTYSERPLRFLMLTKMTAPYIPDTCKNIHQIASDVSEVYETNEELAAKVAMHEATIATQEAKIDTLVDTVERLILQVAELKKPVPETTVFKKPLLPLAFPPSKLQRAYDLWCPRVPFVKLPNHRIYSENPDIIFNKIDKILSQFEELIVTKQASGKFIISDKEKITGFSIQLYAEGELPGNNTIWTDRIPGDFKTFVEFDRSNCIDRWWFSDWMSIITNQLEVTEKSVEVTIPSPPQHPHNYVGDCESTDVDTSDWIKYWDGDVAETR